MELTMTEEQNYIDDLMDMLETVHDTIEEETLARYERVDNRKRKMVAMGKAARIVRM